MARLLIDPGLRERLVPMKFRTTLLAAGKTATGIEIPPGIVEDMGAGRRPPVQVTINGHTYRSTVARMGGRFLLPVSAEVRKAAGVAAGDEVAPVTDSFGRHGVFVVSADTADEVDTLLTELTAAVEFDIA